MDKTCEEQEKELRKRLGYREDFDWENRFDLKTRVGDYEVSTVDLGFNHQFIKGLPPLYYETMIFYEPKNKKIESFEDEIKLAKENTFDYYQERYSTEEEAIKGHEKAIEIVIKNIGK